MGYSSVRERLGDGVVLLDGSVATEVLARTGRWVRNGIEASPDVIRRIHADYIEAGADVIRADTFQIARHTFLSFFHDLEHMRAIGAPGLERRAAELHRMAVGYALEARRAAGAEERVAVAGSISPLNHPFRSDLAPDAERAEEEHAETAASLARAGVDFLMLEAMSTLGEAAAALRGARRTGLPVWVSLIPDAHGQTLGGEPLAAAGALAAEGAEVVLVDAAPPMTIGGALGVLAAAVSGAAVGASALIGRYAPPSWKMDFYPRFVGCDAVPPESYAQLAGEWVAAGARVVGGGLGTTPAHVRASAAAVS